jgi:hypothetical protein
MENTQETTSVTIADLRDWMYKYHQQNEWYYYNTNENNVIGCKLEDLEKYLTDLEDTSKVYICHKFIRENTGKDWVKVELKNKNNLTETQKLRYTDIPQKNFKINALEKIKKTYTPNSIVIGNKINEAG